MAQYVIYADTIAFLNFSLDGILLFGTARFCNCVLRPGRLLLAACAGAAYALSSALPALALLSSWPAKLLASVLLLLLAFGRMPLQRFLRVLLVFYGVSFLMAGVATAFAASRAPMLLTLAAAFLTALLLSFGSLRELRARRRRERSFVNICVSFMGVEKSLRALLDTGNELREPQSGAPVVLAEFSCLRPLFSRMLTRVFREYAERDIARVLLFAVSVAPGGHWCLVPYRSVGREDGFLLGFRPERFLIEGKDCADVVLCLVPGRFGSRDSYQALLSPRLMAEEVD